MGLDGGGRVTISLVYGKNVFATGVKRYAEELTARMHTQGIDAEVVILSRREWRVAGRPVGGFASFWMERLRADFSGFDLVHALDPAVATRHTDIVTVHDLVTEMYPEWYQQSLAARLDWRFTRRLARRAPWFIADSDVTRDELIARWNVDPERVVTIHLGIDADHFHPVSTPAPYLAPEKPNLVYLGDDNPRKNLGLIVAALAHLKATQGLDVRFVRMGPSRFPAVHGAYRAFAKANDVDLVEPGFVDDKDVPAIFSNAAAFVWPTMAEGFGFPPLEAMACGTPVIALDTPINREICGVSTTYHANTVEGASEAIAKTLAKPPASDGVMAHAHRFTWASCVEKTLDVYAKVRADRDAKKGL